MSILDLVNLQRLTEYIRLKTNISLTVHLESLPETSAENVPFLNSLHLLANRTFVRWVVIDIQNNSRQSSLIQSMKSIVIDPKLPQLHYFIANYVNHFILHLFCWYFNVVFGRCRERTTFWRTWKQRKTAAWTYHWYNCSPKLITFTKSFRP